MAADFVGIDATGKKVEIDVKAFNGNGQRPYDRQTQDIIGNIKNLLGKVEDVTKVQIVCDISPTFCFLHKTRYNDMVKGLNSTELKQVKFLFE